MLFDETPIANLDLAMMDPTSNGEGRIVKGIIHQTIDLGQQIVGSNIGFKGHAQGVEVVLQPAPNQSQNELDSPIVPSDPRSGSNEILGVLDLELETILIVPNWLMFQICGSRRTN